MLVSQISSANFQAIKGFGLVRKNHSTVTRFEMPLKDDKTAAISVTENVAKGIINIAYEILKDGRSIEAKSVMSPNGLKSRSYKKIISDIDNKADKKCFIIEFLNAKSKLLG